MTHADKQQQRSAANVIGGKTARACDSCLRRRARWYCAADDAFLCQACDASVHSANPLARRHERLRLKTSSSSSSTAFLNSDELSPPWLHGFRRKARTPRPHHNAKMAKMVDDSPKVWTLVPDLETSTDESKEEEEEEQLLYRVPIFDPVLAEFCSPPPLDDANPCAEEVKPAVQLPISHSDGLAGFLPSDIDIDFAEFAADMETLLGQGLDEGSVGIEGLGLMDSPEGNLYESLGEGGAVKVEINDDEVAAGNLEVDIDLSRETMEFNFDCESPTTGEEEEEKVSVTENGYKEEATAAAEERTVMLKLDYEAVITTWSSQGTSPWTNGERPQFSLDECWPNYTGTWGGGGGEMHGMYGDLVGGNLGEREARVTRYREKRRTRLFSKKIRYEVRKLNAEKRPRMKGRFVKRASFSGATAATPVFPY